jgi:hypothetical protein
MERTLHYRTCSASMSDRKLTFILSKQTYSLASLPSKSYKKNTCEQSVSPDAELDLHSCKSSKPVLQVEYLRATNVIRRR